MARRGFTRVVRRSNDAGSTVSLFPFLSVLACVIGTLTLLITAIAAGQMADEIAHRGDDPSALGDGGAERSRQVAQLEARLAELAATQYELEELRSRVNRVRVLSAESRDQTAATLRSQAALQRRIADLRRESEELDAAIDKLIEELDSLPEPLAPARIQIQPGGINRELIPFFAECSADGVRIRRAEGDWSLPLRIDDIVDGPRFKVFLNKVRSIRTGTVIFLIRPNGVATYEDASRYAERLAIRHGKLALPGFGELDFGLF